MGEVGFPCQVNLIKCTQEGDNYFIIIFIILYNILLNKKGGQIILL